MDNSRQLVGSVVERKPGAPASAPKARATAKNGFPVVEHRSRSAFARGMEAARKKGGSERIREVPIIQTTPKELKESAAKPSTPTLSEATSEEVWMRQVSEENQRRVEGMSEEELEQERKEILERFGSGVGDILKKARDARDKREREVQKGVEEPNYAPAEVEEKENEVVHEEVKRHANELHDTVKSPLSPTPPRPVLSRSSTRPPSRADRKLRFAELTPEDVHVYQSAPPSPKRKPLTLMGVSAADREDHSIVSLGQWQGGAHIAPHTGASPEGRKDPPGSPHSDDADKRSELEEGSPEYIRRHFFPDMPTDDPSLAWITSRPSYDSNLPSALRFDLSGTPIPASLSTSLPTHLGLHHHAEGTHAGYTIDDIFLLSRSTVPAQRASMLGVLARIASRLGKGDREGMEDLRGKEEDLRKRIVAAGIEALGQRGGVGVMAVEVIWECVVRWDEELGDIEGVEFVAAKEVGPTVPESEEGKKPTSGRDTVSTLPLDYLLPQVADALSTVALPEASLSQLLAILHRLAQYSNAHATSITGTPGLLSYVVSTFLLTPIPPSSTSLLPNPLAIQLLSSLALASRPNASTAATYADALLRFVVTLPSDSPYSQPLATALLASTLEFYSVLASYGLYASVATTAAEHLHSLGNYVLSQKCTSKRLMAAYANLLAAWIVCATDPHQTTPSHEILWTQVVGWSWGEEVLDLRAKLEEDGYQEVWAGVWSCVSAWLEGVKINGIKGGEEERTKILERISDGFEAGKESGVVSHAIENLQHSLQQLSSITSSPFNSETLIALREMSKDAKVLAVVLRLWLACALPLSEGPPPSPPFLLPFEDISSLAAQLSKQPIWSCLQDQGSAVPSYVTVFLRPLSSFLSLYLRLSRRLPGTTPDLWLAQACTIVQRVVPGDEDFTQRTLEQITSLVTPGFINQAGWNVPNVIWENGGMQVITPFYFHSVHPQLDEEEQYGYIGPLHPTPQSIALSATQRVPSLPTLRLRLGQDFGVPLSRDWPFTPLDHLLRSGTSLVFKALPSSWNASETDVTRAVLMLAKVVQDVVRVHGLGNVFGMTREEVVFGCMKVFMLEHGQDEDSNGIQEEVFRDNAVGSLMGDLLAPFTWAASASTPALSPSSSETLEQVSRRFLGTSTPFYQFYTDFLGLYDSISFSHPLFARLLLPPLSMRYPVDYRKVFWDDYHHILRTIRTSVEDVLTGDLVQYLYPVESDKTVVAAYLRALVKPGAVQGFLRFVAVHQVAAHIWTDLQSPAASDDEKTEKLIQSVVTQAGLNVVREVVLYKQGHDPKSLLLPPQCFEQTGPWKEERLRQAEKWGLKDRLRGLLT